MQAKRPLPAVNTNRHRTRIFLALAGGLLVAGVLTLALQSKDEVTLPPDTKQAEAAKLLLPAQLLEESRQRQQQLKDSLQAALNPADAQDAQAMARKAIRVGFKSLLAQADYFDKDDSEMTIFLTLSQNKNVKYEIIRALSEKNYARGKFEEEQDVVRYYGIRYLAHLADQGEGEPLESALVQLSQNLIQDKPWMKGQWNDLEDLLTANVSRGEFKEGFGLKEFFDQKGIRVDELDAEIHKDFLMSIMHGAYDGLRTKMTHKSVEEEISKLMPEYIKG
jgi:hypothetical protein